MILRDIFLFIFFHLYKQFRGFYDEWNIFLRFFKFIENEFLMKHSMEWVNAYHHISHALRVWKSCTEIGISGAKQDWQRETYSQLMWELCFVFCWDFPLNNALSAQSRVSESFTKSYKLPQPPKFSIVVASHEILTLISNPSLFIHDYFLTWMPTLSTRFFSTVFPRVDYGAWEWYECQVLLWSAMRDPRLKVNYVNNL